MANIRKGVSIFIGSMPQPISLSAPRTHTTDTRAATTVRLASFTEVEYRNSSSQVKAMVSAKNLMTERAPSLMSPTTLAKPMMWTVWFSASYLVRMASNWCATCW